MEMLEIMCYHFIKMIHITLHCRHVYAAILMTKISTQQHDINVIKQDPRIMLNTTSFVRHVLQMMIILTKSRSAMTA